MAGGKIPGSCLEPPADAGALACLRGSDRHRAGACGNGLRQGSGAGDGFPDRAFLADSGPPPGRPGDRLDVSVGEEAGEEKQHEHGAGRHSFRREYTPQDSSSDFCGYDSDPSVRRLRRTRGSRPAAWRKHRKLHWKDAPDRRQRQARHDYVRYERGLFRPSPA